MLGQRLVKLRTKRGLTQEQLSKMLNMSRSTYAQYEVDRRTPNAETIKMFATFFNTTTDYLLDHNLRTASGSNDATIAAHRSDDPLSALPPEARKSLEEFQDYILKKYGLKND